MRVLFLMLCTVSSVMAWTVPVLLEQGTVIAYDLYYDQNTGLQHLLATYDNIHPESVVYYQINEDNKVVYSSRLNDSNVLYYTGVKITGTGNGKTLYAVLEGKYKHGHFSDTDQLFTESNDGGKTWSTLVPVPRKDMNDGCQRTGECILPIGGTGRLYIFYPRY